MRRADGSEERVHMISAPWHEGQTQQNQEDLGTQKCQQQPKTLNHVSMCNFRKTTREQNKPRQTKMELLKSEVLRTTENMRRSATLRTAMLWSIKNAAET